MALHALHHSRSCPKGIGIGSLWRRCSDPPTFMYHFSPAHSLRSPPIHAAVLTQGHYSYFAIPRTACDAATTSPYRPRRRGAAAVDGSQNVRFRAFATSKAGAESDLHSGDGTVARDGLCGKLRDRRAQGFLIGRHMNTILQPREKKAPSAVKEITPVARGAETSVHLAIAGNVAVTFAKFGAFLTTGSAVMLSETFHSIADVANEMLLAIGIRRARREADKMHPYGYGTEQFVWALVSAVGIFFLGAGASVYHGIHGLMHPSVIEDPSISAGVICFSFLIEGSTFLYACKATYMDAKSKGMGWWDYVIRGPDPMGVAVLVEDGAAVLGLFIASATLSLTYWTGDPTYDSIGSIMVGGLLAGVSLFLIQRNRHSLLGVTIPSNHKAAIIEQLSTDPVVREVHDFKAIRIDGNQIRVKAELDFDGEALATRLIDERLDVQSVLKEIQTEEDLRSVLVQFGDVVVEHLGDEVDRIESDLKEKNPDLRHIDLESN